LMTMKKHLISYYWILRVRISFSFVNNEAEFTNQDYFIIKTQ
jgi:hypothetical protein